MQSRRKEIRSYRAVALTSVFSKWYASCIVLCLVQESEPENWEETARGRLEWNKLSTPGSNGNIFTTKTLGMAGGQNSHVDAWQCGCAHAMYLAIMDIKTVFDDARLRHVAESMEHHETHGWLIAAHLREMSELEVEAMFECMESEFVYNRCLRRGSVEVPRLWQKIALIFLADVEEGWMKKRMGIFTDFEDERARQICSFMWGANCWMMSHSKKESGADAT